MNIIERNKTEVISCVIKITIPPLPEKTRLEPDRT